MSHEWVRYAKFWLIAIEARTELILGRWLSRLITLLWVGMAVFIATLLCTAALVFWFAEKWGWVSAFLVASGLWLGGAFLIGWGAPRWLRNQFAYREALYRYRLARAGIRLMERGGRQSVMASFPSLWGQWILPFVWRMGKRWLMRKLRQWWSHL
ncbi:MAG: hypothetical protein N2170_02235 [Bacteroidia bacterium]|nr:hypothetical protein [Bacteroidia bacterium]